MSWISAIGPLVIATLLVCVPGLAVSLALGLRGIGAWAAAPMIGIALLAGTGVLCGMFTVTWSVWAVLALTTIVALLVFAVTRLVIRQPREPEPGRLGVAFGVGMLVAIAVGAVAIRGTGGFNELSQTFDAVFHYNAIRDILEGGSPSSLALGSLADPNGPDRFYPAAFHDLVSLTVLLTSASVPVAVNAVALILAVVVWPASCALLARQVFGRSARLVGATVALSVAFSAFPWGLLSFGVLWPNVVGFAVLPASLAAVVSLCGLTREDVLGRRRAVILLVFGLIAGAFGHPNSIFSLLVLSVVPILAMLVRVIRHLLEAGRRVQAFALIAGVALVVLGGYLVIGRSTLLAKVSSVDWRAYQTPPQALGEVLFNATNRMSASWVLSALVVIGMVTVWRTPRLRWLVLTHGLSAIMFMFASALDTPLSASLTGFWYNDSFRLAAVLPVTGVPLAAHGAVAVGLWLYGLPRNVRWDWWRPSTVVAATLAAIFVVTEGFYAQEHAMRIRAQYGAAKDSPQGSVVSDEERRFFASIAEKIPEDAVVANNPWDGSALLWALEDRKVLITTLQPMLDRDYQTLVRHLRSAADRPEVCAAAARHNVRFLLVGDRYLWPGDGRVKEYPGLTDPIGQPGFELVAREGPMKLYRLTACG